METYTLPETVKHSFKWGEFHYFSPQDRACTAAGFQNVDLFFGGRPATTAAPVVELANLEYLRTGQTRKGAKLDYAEVTGR